MDEITRLQQLAGILFENNTIDGNTYVDSYGRLKSKFGKFSYDFGGEEDPVPQSVVVDLEKSKTNPTIIHDLNEVGNFSTKDFINMTFVLGHIHNYDNLEKTINNSLKVGGILVLTEVKSWVEDFYINHLQKNFKIINIYDFTNSFNESIQNYYENQKILEKMEGYEEWSKFLPSPKGQYITLFDIAVAEKRVAEFKNPSLIKKHDGDEDDNDNAICYILKKIK